MAVSSHRSHSRRNLWLGLTGGVVLLLCVCLVFGIAGSVALYLRRNPPVTQTAGPSVVYLLDASPRMALPSQSGTRLTVARGVLAEIVRPADPSLMAGLRVFGTGAANAKPCQDTDVLVPLAPSNQTLISEKASAVEAGQSTDSALAHAIVAAIRDLATKTGPHSLVVVTGGADSCNPEASQVVAAEAKRAGIDLETYVIGFEVSEAEAQAIKVVVDQTPQAHYLDAPNEMALRSTLRGVQDRVDHPAASYARQTACDYPYLPMRKGATWEYTQGDTLLSQAVTEVTGDVNNATATMQMEIGQGASFTYEWTCNPEGVLSSALTSFHFPGSDASGVTYKVTSKSGSFLVPPDKLIPGANWESAYTMDISLGAGDQSVNMTYTFDQNYTAVGVENVTTPAGTFEAIRVDVLGQVTISGLPAGVDSSGLPSEMSTAYTQWFARGVGLVRSTSGTAGTPAQELTKFTVP